MNMLKSDELLYKMNLLFKKNDYFCKEITII